MSEKGPIYGVELLDSLPLTKGGMTQAMPSRKDLERCNITRIAAGYEVLLAHYREALDILDALTDPDECSLDHHGYCQAHTWLNAETCPHARAKVMLAGKYPLSKGGDA